MTPFAIQNAVDAFLATWTTTSIRDASEEAPAIPYIEPHILLGDMIGLEIQGAAERIGVLIINIFTRTDKGNLEGYAYGGALEKLFWHESTEDIFFENGDQMPSTAKIGVDTDRQAFHFQTKIPFNIIMEY